MRTQALFLASLLLTAGAFFGEAAAPESPLDESQAESCIGAPCDAINAVCWLVWKVGKGKVISDPTCVK